MPAIPHLSVYTSLKGPNTKGLTLGTCVALKVEDPQGKVRLSTLSDLYDELTEKSGKINKKKPNSISSRSFPWSPSRQSFLPSPERDPEWDIDALRRGVVEPVSDYSIFNIWGASNEIVSP